MRPAFSFYPLHWLVGWLVGWSADRSVDRSVGRSVVARLGCFGLFVRGLRAPNESGACHYPLLLPPWPLAPALYLYASRLSWKLIAVNSDNNDGIECVCSIRPLLSFFLSLSLDLFRTSILPVPIASPRGSICRVDPRFFPRFPVLTGKRLKKEGSNTRKFSFPVSISSSSF